MSKLLIVDDSPLFRKIIRSEAEQFDFNIFETDSIKGTKEFLKMNIPDIITLDNQLGDGIGLELCRELKSDDKFSQTQIVMVTSDITEKTKDESFDAGAVGFFHKDELKDNLGEFLDNLLDPTKKSFFGKRTALLIEDSSIQRKFIKGLLTRIGIGVIELASYKEAADYFFNKKDKPFDIIITDYNLEDGRTSVQIMDYVRKQPKFDSVPIISMTTSGGNSEIKRKLFNAGVNDFLEKPFDVEEFYLRLKAHLRNRHFYEILQKQKVLLEIEATTDHLTKLYNRRFFFKKLSETKKQHAKNDKIYSVLLFDIDHFKKVNDTFGHDVGDEVLKGISGVIKGTVFDSMTPARYGGEEFVIVIPESTKSSAVKFAEILRKDIENKYFESMKRGVTVSIGVADSTESGDPDDLLKIADERLYKAKESGRNRVVSD